MRIGRGIIIPAILALGVAGSVVASSGMAAATALTPAAHVQTSATLAGPLTVYHG